MKKIGLFLSVSLLTVASCSKDDKSGTKPTSNVYVEDIQKGPSPSNADQILVFSTWETFDSTLLHLENAVELHDDEFVSQYPGLTDDELDSIEGLSTHNVFQPLDDFEALYGFSSWRHDYVVAEETWLDNDVLDTTNHPGPAFADLEELELTLLNKDGAVVIGTTIYVFRSDALYEFPGMDYDGYLAFVGKTSLPSDIFVKSALAFGDGCSSWKTKSSYREYDNYKKQVRIKIRYHSYPHKGVTKATIKSYKKKSNGKWKKHRSKIGAASQNSYYTDDCTVLTKQFFDAWEIKKKKSLGNFGAYYAPLIMKVKNGEITGLYRYNYRGSIYDSATLRLTW